MNKKFTFQSLFVAVLPCTLMGSVCAQSVPDAGKIQRELGWEPVETFASGIRKTVEWYLANETWVNHVVSGDYKNWVQKQYA